MRFLKIYLLSGWLVWAARAVAAFLIFEAYWPEGDRFFVAGAAFLLDLSWCARMSRMERARQMLAGWQVAARDVDLPDASALAVPRVTFDTPTCFENEAQVVADQTAGIKAI